MPRRPSKSPDQPTGIGHSSLVIPRQRRGGFALLITITLLAFLVLLLVSLAALTRVETQVASNNQQIAQARQNALMALNIAIGQLQKYAGPDQRTTARADLENGATVPNARWTGVYGSAVPADYNQTPSAIATALTTPANINATTGSPARLLTWLVSGNENGAFNPSSDVGSKGEITPTATALAAGIEFKPNVATGGLNGSATTATPLTIVAGGTTHEASLLVGPGSVRTAVDSGHALDYVAAPLVKIEVLENTLPGFAASSTTPKTIGRYAWWVGDEGVKARANLPLTTDASQKPKAFVSSQRNAVELMNNNVAESPAPSLTAPRIGTLYDLTQPVERILATKQFPLSGTNSAASTALTTALEYRFHDLTTHSTSVLADTYAGGLKRDLSTFLAAPGVVADDARTLFTPEPSSNSTVSTFAMPTWGHLRSFAQMVVPTTPGAEKLTFTPPVLDKTGEANHVGVVPVMTYMAVGLRYEVSGGNLRLRYYPVVVLWNPYTAPIKPAEYEAGLSVTYNTRLRVQIEDSTTAVQPGWRVIEQRDFRYAGRVVPSGYRTDGDYEYMRFLVRVTTDIQAGQSLVFTLDNASDSYNPGLNVLTHGLNDNHYVYSVGEPIPEPGKNLRVVSRFYPFTETSAGVYSTTSNSGGSSLSHDGGGTIFAYLGAPRPVVAPKQWDPTKATVNWYQIIQKAGFDDNDVRRVTTEYKVTPPGTFFTSTPAPGSSFTTPFTGTESVIQDGVNLENGYVGDEPAFTIGVAAVFSAMGSNKNLNKGTNLKQRWIAQSNLRAPYSFRTTQDLNYNAPYIGQVGSIGLSYNKWPLHFFTDDPGDEASAGAGHDWDSTTNKPVRATLFEFRPDDQPLFSIGQLQHANLSLIASYPSYPVGNSLADFRLTVTQLADNVAVAPLSEMASFTKQAVYYDTSWLLNHALWDRYFFSTVPLVGSVPKPLPNTRHIVHLNSGLQDPDTAAAGLLLSGGFNINSTSEQAWRAVLAGLNKLAYNPLNPSDSSAPALVNALSRFSRPTAGTDPAQPWEGYRSLSDEQIAQLARNIVAQIRIRGPFVSLADFINRRLIDNTTAGAPSDERLKGAIQAAIDATTTTAGGYPTNDATNPASFFASDPVITGLASQPFVLNNMRGTTTAGVPPYSGRSAFAPKFITQGDVLSTIGAGLSARSDTFIIRTYGDTMNPVTGDINGRAWCEAVVQRLPEYVAPSIAPETRLDDSLPSSLAKTTNQAFGRKFKIISFRWLSPSDI
ncbi:MAG: hypothetical protein K0R17_540 [Rariglobus sp.]|jgi:hypothetical protein|nr:hypothetical protein [Rariglobus sp.]